MNGDREFLCGLRSITNKCEKYACQDQYANALDSQINKGSY